MHGKTILSPKRLHRITTRRALSRPALVLGMLLAGGTAAAAAPRAADPALLSALNGAQMPDQRLAQARGGELLIQSATSEGRVTGTANGATTGHIVDTNSINATGITNVFQNTGNNALIQNTMTVNINVR